MKSEIIVDAAEYNAATNRVSSALQLLRDEMKSLRHQDITLMRQLININDKIRSMSKDHTTAKNRAKRMRNRTLNVSASINQTTPFSNWQTAIVRQQSVPRYCEVIPEVRERRGSTSSDEESSDGSLSGSVTSLDEEEASDSSDSFSTAIPVFKSPMLQGQRSRSLQTPETNRKDSVPNKDTKFEVILNRNVKLWKISQDTLQTSDTDSVFEEETEEENVL